MSLLDMALQDILPGERPPEEDGETHAEAIYVSLNVAILRAYPTLHRKLAGCEITYKATWPAIFLAI